MLKHFFFELKDEAADFFEDFGEAIFHVRRHIRLPRTVTIGGMVTTVRPAYLFAERLENLLKVIFGVSIVISAFSATFVGFTKLSDLLSVLMFTIFGRVLMGFIGISYLLTALWKMLKIKPVSSERQEVNTKFYGHGPKV